MELYEAQNNYLAKKLKQLGLKGYFLYQGGDERHTDYELHLLLGDKQRTCFNYHVESERSRFVMRLKGLFPEMKDCGREVQGNFTDWANRERIRVELPFFPA